MNALFSALFASAFVFIQCYISGTRLAFSLPAYALIGIAGAVAVFGLRSKGGTPGRGCVAAMVLCFGYILGRAFCSPVDYLARADFYMVLACLVVYGLTVRHFFETSARLSIITAMFVLALAEVLIGLWQFSNSDGWMPFGLMRAAVETRASGMFISSIHFAGYLEAIGPFALALMAWGTRNRGARLLSGFIAMLCYLGVVISGSRGGWLSSLFSLGVFAVISFLLTKWTNRARLGIFLLSSTLAVIAAGAGVLALMERSEMLRKRMDLVSRIGAVASGDKAAGPYDIRVYNWQAALDQWKLDRWTGTGAGTHLYYGRQFRRPQLQADPEHAHSDYLELLAEYGILGAVGMALFLATHLRSGARRFRRLVQLRAEDPYAPSHELAINIGALTAVSAYLAHSVVDFNLHLPGNALLFAFIFGILATEKVPASPAQDGDDPTPRRFTAGGALLPPLGIALTILSIAKLPGEYWCEKARVAIRDGRYAEAITFAGRALASEKRNPFIYYHLGQAHRRNAMVSPRYVGKTDLELAERAYRAGLDLFPQDEALWVRLGQTLDALADYKNARIAYEAALQLDPNLGILYAYYAKHLKTVGREAEAEEAIAKGQKLTPINLSTFFIPPPLASEAPEASGE